MNVYRLTVRTATRSITYSSVAVSSIEAALDAVELYGDTPCGITVMAEA